MRIGLFEDAGVAGLDPLTFGRAAFDLYCGLTTLAGKQGRFFGRPAEGLLVRPLLAAVVRLQHPAARVNDPAWLTAGPVVLVNGRWLPPPHRADPTTRATGPHVALVGGEVAYAVLEPAHLAALRPEAPAESLAAWANDLPQRDAGGRLIAHPWELVEANGEQIVRDFTDLNLGDQAGWRPATLAMTGPAERLFIDRTARIDPLVVADTTGGPIVIDREAVVSAFSRLEGPCYVGPGTQVKAAQVHAGTTLGPECRIGGEVESSIVQGYTNKAHDGFLGHSYLGEWVNFGAGTHTSDLRLDYGPVSVPGPGGLPVPTGLRKVGGFVGDHVKTGLNTLLNTGSRVGAFSQILPTGRLAPRHVPPFVRCVDGALREADLETLFATAAVAMARRGCEFTDAHRALFRTLREQAAPPRTAAEAARRRAA
jgi:UDP-N-acetylglucosamine diphosphorylase/glucosamine-1-phosphate N-acetyltransferase